MHILAVLRDRPMDLILHALRDRLRELADSAGFAAQAKRIVGGALSVISDRWSARLSVHVWDRMNLSRRRMDDLQHLLSSVYDPLKDSYQRIVVWRHPTDSNNMLTMPQLVGRAGREQLFAKLADAAEINVGDNGRCERDAQKCAAQMYARFARALRSDFSEERPAQPILFFDGTGCALGKGIAHAELGSADFAGDVQQSRATLSPLALYEGNDHALPLRANLSLCMKSFNALIAARQIDTEAGECIPCAPIVVGDMQGAKCMMGMTERCHSVWCLCKARPQLDNQAGPQHNYGAPDSDFACYDDMLQFYEEIGCVFKTEDFLLACAHLSKGCFYGGKFTPFECPCCGYKPSAAKYRADLTAFNAKTDTEQAEARKAHVKEGGHWQVELFMGPMPKGLGMRRVGVDDLHLIYLNFFKHVFKYTVHESLPPSKRALVAQYLRAANFYSYDAEDESEDPCKRWIGREVKRFLHEADQHLPFLLRLSSGQIDACAETLAATNAAGQEEMDVSGDEFEATEEEVATEAAREPLLAQNAVRWDNFLEWVRHTETPWPEDSLAYRKARALQYCNDARRCARDLHELKPTMQTWVPHIACNIVPRQIVELGNSSRRSADACESFGACAKRVIKLLTCHRRIGLNFRRGYVEQAFRRLAVRSDLLHGPENEPFILRQDAKMLGSGRREDAPGRVQSAHMSVRVKIEQEAERA